MLSASLFCVVSIHDGSFWVRLSATRIYPRRTLKARRLCARISRRWSWEAEDWRHAVPLKLQWPPCRLLVLFCDLTLYRGSHARSSRDEQRPPLQEDTIQLGYSPLHRRKSQGDGLLFALRSLVNFPFCRLDGLLLPVRHDPCKAADNRFSFDFLPCNQSPSHDSQYVDMKNVPIIDGQTPDLMLLHLMIVSLVLQVPKRDLQHFIH